jgi:hypothetical protein
LLLRCGKKFQETRSALHRPRARGCLGETLHRIVEGPKSVWVVGLSGTILHYNGATWSSVASGTMELLEAVGGTSASDVWAVGLFGTILHYNGTTWSSVSSGTTWDLGSIWGSSASDVWAVGGNGTILHGSLAP